MAIPAFIAAAAGSTVTRTLVVRGGTAVILYVTTTGLAEEIFPDSTDEIEALETAIKDVGGTIVSGLGNATLEVIEGAGEAVVKGLDRTFNYIGDKFIRGREPDIIAGFTVTILSLLAAVYLYNSVKNANDAFE
tara:strand:+ start:12719 stop:13120 length:402 start_codon:yes stop_codon:yes gene_type:complete